MITPGTVYIARGGAESLPQIESLLAESGISMHGVDAFVRTYTHFGVDDARAIISKAQLSAIGAQRVFVIVASTMTIEAQNALLKTFEEAPGGAVFVVLVPSPDTLLPTVRSRSQSLMLAEATRSSIDVGEFFAAGPDARLDLLKPLLDKDDDDRRDTGAILDFLAGVERRLGTRVHDASAREALRAVYAARNYLGDKGALVKTLLESIAFAVPRS